MKLNFHFQKPHFLTKKKTNNSNKGKIKNFFSQFSRGLMLPIAILPIAGLLLGIGGAIGANLQNNVEATVAANVFKGMSDVVFSSLPILFSVALTITFSKDKGSAAFCSMLAYLVFCSIQLAFMQFNSDGNLLSIMWFHKDPNVLKNIVTSTFGFKTLQTSIFGGIVVGLITSLIYNYISKVKLPQALDFFSGVRLVPIVLIPAITLLSIAFLIFWPWLGYAINFLGLQIQKAPYGSGGFIYGVLTRAIMPLGLHHILIVLAFQTDLGGTINLSDLENALISNGYESTSEVYKTIITQFQNINATSIVGDQNIWNFINGLSYNKLYDLSSNSNLPLFDWFNKNLNVYAGRYTQDYPTYLGTTIGIGAAIIFTCKKENRKIVSSVIGSAMLVSFLTGITEPIEYTFLFCAPWLYYLVYVPLSGCSYLFMELLNAHVGTGFARGFIDLVIYGGLPYLKGTNFYWAFPLAFGEGVLAFLMFSFVIKKFNLSTPGRNDNNYNFSNAIKTNNKNSKISIDDQKVALIVKALGGLNNIEDISACATRLRINVKNMNLIDKNQIKSLGSQGEVYLKKGLQLIYGGYATILSDKINSILNGTETLVDISFLEKENSSNSIEVQSINNIIDIDNENNVISNNNKNQEREKENKTKEFIEFNVYSPFDGFVYYLKDVDDEVFKNKILGDGIAIKPKSSRVYSPIEKGELIQIFDTNHCYIFQTEDKTKVMMHIGIDSIKLKESPFALKTKEKAVIDKSTNIVDINISILEKAKSSVTPIVIPHLDSTRKIEFCVKNRQIVKQGDLLFKVR